MPRTPGDPGQLGLWDLPTDVFWCVPVDKHGRSLTPIALTGNDWKPVSTWGYLASKAADDLGPDATADELYQATTLARHLYYMLTGDRGRLDLELGAMPRQAAEAALALLAMRDRPDGGRAAPDAPLITPAPSIM